MSTTVSINPNDRRRFVPLEFHALIDAGFFRPEEHPWLNDGVIFDSAIGQPRRFTTDDLARMADLGFFDADGEDRIELIDGEILMMSRVNALHSACIRRLNKRLNALLQGSATVDVQLPLWLDKESQPQPDLCIVKSRDDNYERAHPRGNDVLLVIEVMDSSATRDRNIKLPKYAEAGITEVWLVDVRTREVEVCRNPSGDQYLERRACPIGLTLDIQAIPGLEITVNEIFG